MKRIEFLIVTAVLVMCISVAAIVGAETIFNENFGNCDDGTWLSKADWTMMQGDVKITTKTVFGESTKAINGSTPTAEYMSMVALSAPPMVT